MRSAKSGGHVSGAEGIYDKNDLSNIVKEYTERALIHDKGSADADRKAWSIWSQRTRRLERTATG